MTDLDLELVPTGMVAGGAALARDEGGRVVFVDGALPGERVVARVTEERKDFARAVTVEVREPSPDRVAPPCVALAAGCGGCTWQHVAAEAQERLKAGIVVDALRRIGRLADPPVPSVVPWTGRAADDGPPGGDGRRPGRPPAPGHDDAGAAVATDACLAVHPLLEELIVDGRYPGRARCCCGSAWRRASGWCRSRTGAADVRVPPDVVVVAQGDGRPAFVHEEVAGRRFRVSAGSFFQPGPVAAEGLVAAVSAAVGESLAAGAAAATWSTPTPAWACSRRPWARAAGRG